MDLMFALVLVVLLVIAVLYIGDRFGIPSIVLFLVIGMLVGPYGLAIITDQATIEDIGEIGIILLLFTIGLEFSFEQMLREWRTVIIGGLAQVCTTIVAIMGFSMLLGLMWREALVFGFIVSLSSTAIVMKILQERKEVDTIQGRTLLGVLIFQDLAIIPMILITPLLVSSEGPDLENLPYQVAKVAGLLLIIILLAKYVIPPFLYRVAGRRNRELFMITIIGICILIAYLTNAAGLSLTLGAFLAGLIIGGSEYNIDALSHVIPFRDIFASIFFLSIGMLLEFSVLFDDLPSVLFITAFIIIIKFATGAFSAAVLGMQARLAVFTGLALCQIGEFSFVLAQSGLESSLIPNEVYQVFLAAAIITMALTPFVMNASPSVVDFLYRLSRSPAFSKKQAESCMPAGGEELQKNHIIIAGYGLTGMSVARAAEIVGIPYVVIELKPEIIRKEKAARRRNFIFGDAVQEEVLEHAGIRTARTLIVVVSEEEAVPRIVHHARVMSPSVHIVARTRHHRQSRHLIDLGANEVVSEEYESAKEIFGRVLVDYHVPEPDVIRIVERLRRWGYAMFEGGAESAADAVDAEREFDALHFRTFRVEPGSWAAGKTLDELDLENRYGIREFGFRRDTATIDKPPGTTVLLPGDTLVVFTTDANITEMAALFSAS
ncbi:MAG TPA: cation:proton antiporter [Methanoregulaceae archaeon]|nr:cation:proton antiporter [Methanoregulaceae archaeon]HPD74945.1 cation:proton antiporter [Methanoregulaceae archaeon]HRY75794.1 cation:proton antiporter [Methanoregulaceae archaeon]